MNKSGFKNRKFSDQTAVLQYHGSAKDNVLLALLQAQAAYLSQNI